MPESCRTRTGRFSDLRGWAFVAVAAVVVAATFAAPASAADLAAARKLFNSGKYVECVEACAEGVAEEPRDEGWWLLKVRAELATGQYPQALQTFEAANERHDRSLPLLLLGYDVYRANDRPAEADQLLIVIRALASRASWRYTDAASRIALGQALLRAGADARQVLELFYDQAKKDSPTAVEPYIASGELALEKHDYA